MNTKLIGWLASLAFALTAPMAQAIILIDGGSEASTDLIVGITPPTEDVGGVTLSTDGTANFFVEYTTDSGWGLDDVASWLGDDLNGLPQDPKGNPQLGQFPYTDSGLNGISSYIFTIPFLDVGLDPNSLVNDVTWYLAAYAVVTNSTQESAWGDGDIVGNGRVFSVTLSTAVPEPTTLALFGLGLAGLGFTRRRKKA